MKLLGILLAVALVGCATTDKQKVIPPNTADVRKGVIGAKDSVNRALDANKANQDAITRASTMNTSLKEKLKVLKEKLNE